jgi:hypothetical protein
MTVRAFDSEPAVVGQWFEVIGSIHTHFVFVWLTTGLKDA